MAFKIRDGQTFLFQGDSITDCGRRTDHFPLGTGYARMLVDKVISIHPELNINWVNKGISGHTVPLLMQRWEDDTILVKPDWLSILIGINDLHNTLREDRESIDPGSYRSGYESLLERVRAAGKCNIVLLEPFYISRDGSGLGDRTRVLKLLPEYINVVDDMSKKYDTMLLRTQELFMKHLDYRHADYFCGEPVHPNPRGHQVIAEALYALLTD